MNREFLILLLLPFLGSLGLATVCLLSKSISEKVNGPLATLVSFVSFAMALKLAWPILSGDIVRQTLDLGSWIAMGDFSVPMSFALDRLSVVMVLLITGVGSLVHLYSIGYMSHEEGRGRYFSFLNLFLGFMLVLVLGSSLPVLFVGWEGVGLASFLLIGFYYGDRTKAWAGNKAFIVNRLGDAGLLVAMFLAYDLFGTLEFEGILGSAWLSNPHVLSQINWIVFCLLIGAMGKSAQFPLYVWLPDAMAGPTPVSALIHAATMVTAGVYLLARLFPMVDVSTWAQSMIAWVGAITALFAALIALKQIDIKKVLAFSTVSQLGFMVAAVGIGAVDAAVFHLLMHGYFKALLFLGSGSVIHALSGEQNILKMGGLRSYIVLTTTFFAVGTLAIVGFPGMSGWFSKEAILMDALHHNLPIFGILFGAALLTTVYMTRMFVFTFAGVIRDPDVKLASIHDAPSTMLVSMGVLAVASLFGGLLFAPKGMLREHFALGPLSEHAFLPAFLMTGAVLVVLAWAWMYFGKRAKLIKAFEADSAMLSQWAFHQFGWDALMLRLGDVSMKVLGWASNWIENVFGEGLVVLATSGANGLALVGNKLQSGVLRWQIFLFLLGVLGLIVMVLGG